MIGFPKPDPRCKHRWTRPLPNAKGEWAKACVRCRKVRKAKAPKRTKPISDKRRIAMVLYAAARIRVLEKDGGCVACLCPDLGIPCDGLGRLEIDHVRGRTGPLYLDESNMVTLHPAAHQYKTDHARACRDKLVPFAREREAKWAAR